MNKEAERWNSFAREYDKKIFHLPKYSRIRERVLNHIKQGNVLDFGCGPIGEILNVLKKNGNTVWGVDLSPAMVKEAKKNFSGTIICADGKNLPFEDNFFDSVVSVNSILPPSREEILPMFKEIYRVLKNGGRFVAYLVSYDYVKKLLRSGLIDLKVDNENFRVWDTSGWQCFHTKESIETQMQEVGFSEWKIETEIFNKKEESEDLYKIYKVDISTCPPEEYFLVAVK